MLHEAIQCPDPLMLLFFPTAPGAEPLFEQELREAFAHLDPRAELGGVLCEVPAQEVPALCLRARMALGVWWRFARFEARHFGQLQKELKKIDLAGILGEPGAVALKVTSKRSRLYHSKGIAERFFEATGLSEAQEESALKLHLRIFRDKASLSVDLVGGLLPKRGWRKETAKAPLRKDLAAMLLRASGWTPGQPLVDPMCGAGTIPIEAARICAGHWPNGLRAMDYARLPAFSVGPDPRAPMPESVQGAWPAEASMILGMDQNQGGLEIAQRNAARAGVSGIEWRCAKVGPGLRWSVPEGAFVVCNPPYGQRVGHKKKLMDLYAQLGRMVRDANAASRFACIAPRGPWIDALELELKPLVATDFGGTSVTIYSSFESA